VSRDGEFPNHQFVDFEASNSGAANGQPPYCNRSHGHGADRERANCQSAECPPHPVPRLTLRQTRSPDRCRKSAAPSTLIVWIGMTLFHRLALWKERRRVGVTGNGLESALCLTPSTTSPLQDIDYQ